MSLLNNMLGNAAQGLLGGAQQGGYVDTTLQNPTANQYTQNLAKSMVNAKNIAAAQVIGQHTKTAKSTFDPNKEEAFQVPLSQLITLWQAKFNDTWVDMGIEHEQFWFQAYRRLNNADMFEMVEGWVRLREDV